MQKHDFERSLAITLPKVASQSDWNKKVFFNNLCDKLNKDERLITNGISFTTVIPYSTKVDEFERIENKGIPIGFTQNYLQSRRFISFYIHIPYGSCLHDS